ncbi:hypothetical protein [Leuconostoc citreum]
MSEIKNIGIGTLDSSDNSINVYSISAPDGVDNILDSIKDDMESSLSNKGVDVSYYGAYNNQALIDDNNFFLELQNLNDDSEFLYIKNGLTAIDSLSDAEQIALTAKEFQKLESANQVIRFFILEMENVFLLCRINPYNQIIKNKKGLKFVGTESGSTSFDIFYGIVFPEYVSAVLDKTTKKLSVVSPFDFEKMFNLKVVRMAQAQHVFSLFKNGTNTIGKNHIRVTFSQSLSVEKLRTRQITYLSSFDKNQVESYEIHNITEAMKHLNSEDKLKVVNNTIDVQTEAQLKTFVAILHNSILHRMLTNVYEAI